MYIFSYNWFFLSCLWNLRDIRVFQGQSGQVHHAHGCPTTDEDEERDQLVGKEQNHLTLFVLQGYKITNNKYLLLFILFFTPVFLKLFGFSQWKTSCEWFSPLCSIWIIYSNLPTLKESLKKFRNLSGFVCVLSFYFF